MQETSYDVIPYESSAFPQTHPDRLATLARLFGVTAPDVNRCRVLELGAARAENLIPMAYSLPESQFVGVELSARQVAEGSANIEAYGLTNIDLRQLSITDIGDELGQFDYIICHGVYSWVPDAVREAILAVCRRHLAPNGVAYVSYNTYPGWHMRGMIREMMRYHAAQFEGAQLQIQQARALLDFLAQSVPAQNAYGMLLTGELEILRRQADSYLFHEHLEEVNSPVYFYQFAGQAAAHGLQFLAEAAFSTMLASNFPPQVAETLRRVGPDLIRMEQYMDFVRNRTFRQTLLVHAEQVLQRNLSYDNLRGFYIASAAKPVSAAPDLHSNAPEQFLAPNGAALTTPNPITKAAFLELADCWPRSLAFDRLCAAARARLDPIRVADPAVAAQDAQVLGGDLLTAYTANIVELCAYPSRFTTRIDARPVASAIARVQAQKGYVVTNLRHEPIVLDEFRRQLVQRLDGQHDREALVRALIGLVETGVLRVAREDVVISDAAALQEIIENALDQTLPTLAKSALLLQ